MPIASTPPWVPVLVATFGMQVAIMFAALAVPVAGPLLTAEAGLAPETIGYLIALSYLGTVLYLLVGSPVIPRFGPVRVLQAGATLAGLALLLSASGVVTALFLGALLIGLGNGPTVPAGSRILARTVPPAHRTLIFSVKQAGAPLGGILAGLLLPPLALAFGWQCRLPAVAPATGR
jgi:MFS family permease